MYCVIYTPIFRNPGGLKERLENMGKKAIGDQGYKGEPDLISYYNTTDSPSVALFKSRALLRHETFNGMTKQFGILQGRFRNSSTKFKSAFEAVCVICQYKAENEQPLFDILIQRVIDANDQDSDESDDDDSDGSTSSSDESALEDDDDDDASQT